MNTSQWAPAECQNRYGFCTRLSVLNLVILAISWGVDPWSTGSAVYNDIYPVLCWLLLCWSSIYWLPGIVGRTRYEAKLLSGLIRMYKDNGWPNINDPSLLSAYSMRYKFSCRDHYSCSNYHCRALMVRISANQHFWQVAVPIGWKTPPDSSRNSDFRLFSIYHTQRNLGWHNHRFSRGQCNIVGRPAGGPESLPVGPLTVPLQRSKLPEYWWVQLVGCAVFSRSVWAIWPGWRHAASSEGLCNLCLFQASKRCAKSIPVVSFSRNTMNVIPMAYPERGRAGSVCFYSSAPRSTGWFADSNRLGNRLCFNGKSPTAWCFRFSTATAESFRFSCYAPAHSILHIIIPALGCRYQS